MSRRPSPRPSTPSLFGELDEVPEAPPKPPAHEGPFARVALKRPLAEPFTYAIPAELVDTVAPGVRVAVPFGPRREIGVVVAVGDDPEGVDAARVKPIARALDERPALDAELLELCRWMAAEYACSWGEALAAVLPADLKREKGVRTVRTIRAAPGVGGAELAELEGRFAKQHRLLRTLIEIGDSADLRDLLHRLNVGESPARSLAKRGWAVIERVAAAAELEDAPPTDRVRPETLTADQERAVGELTAALGRDGGAFLLQGVTGSGKTEVYLRAIEAALEAGRGAIVAVPEIALTPQTVGWFRSRFGSVAVMHSRMTDAQRAAAWRRVRDEEVRVVVGARSALLAPVRNLGVVVVDEEHEPSFKQGATPRYHGREVALQRARLAKAVCILGSATPALETWAAAQAGELTTLRLDTRVHARPLPEVRVVDMANERPRRDIPQMFSHLLADLLGEAVAAGEQGILFLNRRGYTPVLWCSACGELVRCEQCDVGFTYHRRLGRIVCHACCEERPLPRACPTCTAPELRPVGVGAEQVEAAVRQLLPDVRAKRMDSDTMLRREDYEDTLAAFGRGELDVLVGTQMIAKGLDFPNVTVVGIVDADTALHVPEFRAEERAFQLIAQVAGRAGRGEKPGRIVVQTRFPANDAIQLAAKHDFDAFAAREVQRRAELGYPPYGRLVRAVLDHTDPQRLAAVADTAGRALRAALDGSRAMVLGPGPAPISLLRGRHRMHVLAKCPADDPSFDAARTALAREAAASGPVRFAVDVDPVSLL